MQNKVLEIPLLSFMFVTTLYTLYKRFNLKKADGSPFGLGQRAISLVALLVIVPSLLVLSIENILPKDALVSLLGTIVGYTLSGLTKD